MSSPWFAIQTKHRHEKIVARLLQYKGYEPFVPTYAARRQWSDRIKVVELPLFEGYFFCRVSPRHVAPIMNTPGAIRIVGTGSTPVPIDDAEVEALQRLVASRRSLEPWPYYRTGQRVQIQSGALNGLEGVLQEVRSGVRLIVSVTLLQRSVSVEIESDAVRPVSAGALP
jgi:transcription termination/antitermination protein NusG